MELIDGHIFEPRFRYRGKKGIYPKIEDYDKVFKTLDIQPILANDLDLSTKEGQELFNELVYSKYDGEVFTNTPRCPCGQTQGGDEEGETCDKCGYLCQTPTEQSIHPIVWMKVPEEVGAFINIQVYSILRSRMLKSGFSILDWLIDPRYRPPRLNTMVEEVLESLKIERGLKYFSENFDEVIDKVFSASRVTYTGDRRKTEWLTIRGQRRNELLEFIDSVRDKIFTTYLPFPSKIGFIVENVSSMKYVDPEMKPALSALISIAKAGTDSRSARDAESRVAKAIHDLSKYYHNVDHKKIYDKKGASRKLTFGTTPHFTFRTVITSEHLPHDHETIKIPWGSAVLLFKLHIANKLLKENYTTNDWLSLIYDNVQRKHHKLDRIFDELIAESPGGKGPTAMFTRFPSLKHNSSTRFFLDIKRDPRDMSTSLPILCVKSPNADFDGDYMSGQLAVDNWEARIYDRFAPYTGIMDQREPYKVSDHPMIPHPVMSTINNMLHITDKRCKPYGGK